MLESLRAENTQLKEDVLMENKFTHSTLSLNSNAAYQIGKLQEQARRPPRAPVPAPRAPGARAPARRAVR